MTVVPATSSSSSASAERGSNMRDLISASIAAINRFSVAVTEALAASLRAAGREVNVTHRDVEKAT